MPPSCGDRTTEVSSGVIVIVISPVRDRNKVDTSIRINEQAQRR